MKRMVVYVSGCLDFADIFKAEKVSLKCCFIAWKIVIKFVAL